MRTALVTGATNGVGVEVARRLAQQGFRVLVHGRDEARGRKVVGDIEASGGKASFLRADLASLNDVRALARAVQQQHPKLHLLVNNAGVGSGAPGTGREEGADGHELRLAVNYLAPVLLTRLLLPQLLAAAPSRVVNVASAGQRDIAFDDPQLERRYSGRDAYCQSKLALIMFTFDLAEELKGKDILVNTLHPATYMDTFMVRQAGHEPISTVEEGADAIMHLAVEEQGSGQYFNGLRPARALAQAYDPKACARLRRMTADLIG